MNLVFTYIFNDLFINSFDFSKLSSLDKTLDTEELFEMAENENPGGLGMKVLTW